MLAGVVQHFWIVRWDLRGCEPQVRETLPHPNIHITFDADGARIQGIHSGRFTRVLQGQGGVFGVKFRPGAFRSFLHRSVSTLRDRSLPLRDVFGAAAEVWQADLSAQPQDEAQVGTAEHFLAVRLPPIDPDVARVGEIVDTIAVDREITTVEQVLERWSIGKRTLQRLFNDYVGIGPKWVINRYRLHEALNRLAEGGDVDWVQLALELGYFDQAHFIRDFKALVGRPPAEYARQPA